MSEARQIDLVCAEFGPALDLLRALGLRLDVIYPADDPHTAILTRGSTTVRLTSRPDQPPIRSELPLFQPEFLLTGNDCSGGEGRAGMLYRDLIPGRLGGRYIASHIVIADGGPVADWVHYHKVALQMIYVRRGWVRVVYEDQGDPFVMAEGDLVLQPPQIRHRVLESSPELEVIEIGCPALHETFADHDLGLPTGKVNPERSFSGQRFLHHSARATPWTVFATGHARETGIAEATGGLAEVRTIRPGKSPMVFPAADRELVFGFVVEGSATLERNGSHRLEPADAFVIPPSDEWAITAADEDFRLLEVTTSPGR